MITPSKIVKGGLLAAALILCSSVNLQAKSKLDGTYKGIWTNTQDSFFSGPATIKIKSIGKGNAVNVQISGAVQFVEFNTPVSNPFKASLHATNASGKGKAKVSNPVMGAGKGTGQFKASGKNATLTGKGAVAGNLASITFTAKLKKVGSKLTATGSCQGAYVGFGGVQNLFNFTFVGK